MGPGSFVAAYQNDAFAKAVSVNATANITVNVAFMDGGEWWFTNCTEVQNLTKPDRLSINGTCGGRTAEWTIPATAIKAVCITTEANGQALRKWISVPEVHER